MTIINALREYFKTCPYLAGGYIGVDYLGERAGEYVLEPQPCEPVIKRYRFGGALRRYDFVFAGRNAYTQEVRQQIENCGLFEKIQAWIEEKSEKCELPKLPDGFCAQWIEVTSGGYLFSDDGNNTAVYQMQCRLVYYN